jgi:hypothetical protein
MIENKFDQKSNIEKIILSNHFKEFITLDDNMINLLLTNKKFIINLYF